MLDFGGGAWYTLRQIQRFAIRYAVGGGMMRVTVWNENAHEKIIPLVTEIYPGGIHEEVARILKECDDVEVRTATLDQEECGLPDDVLNAIYSGNAIRLLGM